MPVQVQHNLRSEQLREFINHRPGWLIRWGIPILFAVITGLFAGSYFIQYPDLVKTVGRIQSVNPPKKIIIKSGGRLIKLFKNDSSALLPGDIIGFMESTGNHSEVLQLAGILDTLQHFADSNRLEEIPGFWSSTQFTFSKLGELQQAHQTFMQSFISFKDYLSKGFYLVKKQMLNRDLNNSRQLLQTLLQQKKLQEQDLAISIQNYNVYDTLHNEALINDIDYRNQKSQLINKKMSIPQLNASLLNNQAQQNAMQKEMLELDNQIAHQKALFVQSLSTYRSAVEEWKQKFILSAPVEGRFEFASFLQENQQLQAGQVIGYVTPQSGSYYVEMLVPQTNAGKVKPGQDVLLKFASYPAQEFGSVKGRIEVIKNIPTDSGYLARVILPAGLSTNYRKTILLREGMLAQAEIITEKRSLFDRFFGNIKSVN